MCIYSIPSWAVALIIVTLFLAYSVLGLYITQYFLPTEQLKEHNQLTSGLVPVTGIVFAVLVAFFIVIIWEQYNAALKETGLEAGILNNIWRQASGYPEPLRTSVRNQVVQYMETVINVEWPLMQQGQSSELARLQLERLEREMILFEPSTSSQEQVQRIQLNSVQAAVDARRDRLYAVNNGISASIWFVIIASSLLTIAATWFFGASFFPVHLAGTIILGVAVGLLIYLAVIESYPFSGTYGITPQYFIDELNNIQQYEEVIDQI